MSYKQFAERLNKELDNMDVPSHKNERIEVFSRWLKIPKFKAEAFLEGITLPDHSLLTRIATEFEIEPDWLVGKSELRQKKNSV